MIGRRSSRRDRFPTWPRRTGALMALVVTGLAVAACTEVGTFPAHDLDIIWPARGATLIDEEVLRVHLPGYRLDDYEVYWYVDDGPERRMGNVWNSRTPHKAYRVDTWYWDWRGRGPYTVGFIAEDRWGHPIAHRTVRVYVH
jgi:hypothetical protein